MSHAHQHAPGHLGPSLGGGFKPRASARLAHPQPGCVACKCQICTCGSHKCSPDHASVVGGSFAPDSLVSSYASSFVGHSGGGRAPRRDEHKPRAELSLSRQPFDATSTTQADYRPPHAEPARAARPPMGDPALISGGSNAREWTSENRSSFAPKAAKPRESFAPRAGHLTHLPFDGQSTTQSDYPAHVGAKPSTPYRAPQTVATKADDRDFQTEAALKFVAHGAARRAAFSPPKRSGPALPFEGASTTQSDYRGVAAPPARSCAPAHSRLGDAQQETRDFKTRSALDYAPKGFAARESCKPAVDRSAANLPFDGVSSHKAAFTGAAGERAKLARPAVGLTDTIGVALGSKDDRHFTSENHANFAAKPLAARESFAPRAGHMTHLPFDGQSTTQSDYPAHVGAKPSTPYRAPQTVTTKADDRDFQSEAHLAYPAHPVAKRAAFAPPKRSGPALPFEGQSTTQSDFRAPPPHAHAACPADSLPDSRAPRDAQGHQVFALSMADASGRTAWQPAAAAH